MTELFRGNGLGSLPGLPETVEGSLITPRILPGKAVEETVASKESQGRISRVCLASGCKTLSSLQQSTYRTSRGGFNPGDFKKNEHAKSIDIVLKVLTHLT